MRSPTVWVSDRIARSCMNSSRVFVFENFSLMKVTLSGIVRRGSVAYMKPPRMSASSRTCSQGTARFFLSTKFSSVSLGSLSR